MIHVFSDERPSKRSNPVSTPSHASWTTSSADQIHERRVVPGAQALEQRLVRQRRRDVGHEQNVSGRREG
jgi:hypothetical protein